MSTPQQIPYKQIESITNNFSDENLIGSGLFGNIFEGRLSQSGESIDVAVRRLDYSFYLQEVAFDKEISVLSNLKHENMVSMVGFCYENNEMIIVNKREARGSLNRHLSGTKLTYMQRLKICVGVASALSYLHNASVIHHNVNSTSILLDENWEAKLSGFEYSMRSPSGDLDLAYEKLGIGSYKSDLFSFGIVLFEILCGAKAFTSKDDGSFQAPVAIFHHENRKLHKFVDPDLFSQMDPQSFNIISETACYCLREQRARRYMNQVLERLNKALKLQQKRENPERSAVAVKRTLSPHLKLMLKNLEHMRVQLNDIELATENFASKYCIVSGGFGTVYKAELDHVDREYCCAIEGNGERELQKRRSEVAIKRIFNTEDELGEQGFYGEIEMLTKCKHSNILTLLGFCDEGSVMILIYEYATNGSLADYLQNKSNTTNNIWSQRIKICLDAAKGLRCLHSSEGDREEIVHRDIKSDNILLGKFFDAKIGDFGLSKFLSAYEEHSGVAGTRVYIDPQYVLEARLKKEIDVYSFGVILFEVLFGRLAYDPIYSTNNNKGLALLAQQHVYNGTVKEIIDPTIKEGITKTWCTSIKGPDQDSVDTFSKIAYRCLDGRQDNRPTMEEVIEELEKASLFQENRNEIFQISLEVIKTATNNFNDENRHTGGRFWTLYRGKFNDTIILVKRLDTSHHETEHAFLTELKILRQYKHENVIGLLGSCDEMDERIIVYENLKGLSPNYLLSWELATWTQRLEICIDIASGLDFLHGGIITEEIVIHRDIKSSNILLNSDLKAKIAGFGLSLILQLNQETVSCEYGFVASIADSYTEPHYAKTGLLSKECDIYSLGVVLCEIMFSRKTDDFGNNDHAGPFIKRLGKLDEMVVGGEEHIVPQSLTIFQRIAIQCLQGRREERPTAGEVVTQLKEALEVQVKFMQSLHIPLINIEVATRNFNSVYLVGNGSYWSSYRAIILFASEPTRIIAKRWDTKSAKGENRFQTELKYLFKRKHENIVSLVGYCYESNEKIIVSEYPSKGRLGRHLHNPYITWMTRLNICINIASGLEFLHGGDVTLKKEVCRDIDSFNILLTSDMKAKIYNSELPLSDSLDQDMEHVTDNANGTFSHLDPEYKQGFLTGKSDIYLFGVILLELLSGRREKGSQSLISLAKHHFVQGNLEPMVFRDIKEQIDPKSLNTFVEIAYQCLHDDGYKRPGAGEVVIQLKKALEFQEDYEIWEPKLPKDYEEIIRSSETPENYYTETKKNIYKKLCDGILLQRENVWFTPTDNGIANKMISATMFSYERSVSHKWRSIHKSRFRKVAKISDSSNLKIQITINDQFLSPGVIYGVHLAFRFCESRKVSSKPMYVNLKHKKGSETLHSYFATWRDDEWMTTELCRFLNDKEDIDFEVLLESFSRYYCGSAAIYVQGIEFRAIENVAHEDIENLKEGQQVQESNLIDKVHQFPTNNDDEDEEALLSEVNGKKHLMLSAKEVLYNSPKLKPFRLKPSSESRFPNVVELLPQQVFRIKYRIESQMLSPFTEYVCYLVFKLSEKCCGLHCPVKVHDLLNRRNKETKIIYFRSPATSNLQDANWIPKQRKDGWMEVIVWRFNSKENIRNNIIPMNLKLITYEETMSGLIIYGLKFRPI